MVMRSVGLAAGVFAFAGLASAQFIADGNFDALTPGNNPDCLVPAGAWGWPPHYLTPENVCERSEGQLTIVETSTFDPGATGNSMRLNTTTLSTESVHVVNLFPRTIYEVPGQIVTVTFDVFVPTQGVTGCSVYIGGDHSGTGTGGFTNTRDRGPQLTWQGTGQIFVRLPAGNTPFVNNFPFGAWQSVQLDIDLAADTFDFSWAPTGQPLTLIASDLGYRSTTQAFLDRFTFVHFGDFATTQEAYIDNIVVDYCYADCDQSSGAGVLDIFDFLCFQNEFAAANPYACNCDITLPGVCDIFDFLCFQNEFAAGCP
jgi:hypothetical protein